MNELIYTPLFGIFLTLTIYVLALKIYNMTRSMFLNPVLITIITIILVLTIGRVPFEAYAKGGDMILFLLGPSVVALAIPLFKNWQTIVQKKIVIMTGIASGALTSIFSACGIAWLLGGSKEVILSISPKSVTTPIAISVVENIGGLVPLTAAMVVLTGCLGAACGPEFCRLIGIRSDDSISLAVGTAAHGLGAARMLEIDRDSGVIAGLAISVNGLMTTFLIPLLVPMMIF